MHYPLSHPCKLALPLLEESRDHGKTQGSRTLNGASSDLTIAQLGSIEWSPYVYGTVSSAGFVPSPACVAHNGQHTCGVLRNSTIASVFTFGGFMNISSPNTFLLHVNGYFDGFHFVNALWPEFLSLGAFAGNIAAWSPEPQMLGSPAGGFENVSNFICGQNTLQAAAAASVFDQGDSVMLSGKNVGNSLFDSCTAGSQGPCPGRVPILFQASLSSFHPMMPATYSQYMYRTGHLLNSTFFDEAWRPAASAVLAVHTVLCQQGGNNNQGNQSTPSAAPLPSPTSQPNATHNSTTPSAAPLPSPTSQPTSAPPLPPPAAPPLCRLTSTPPQQALSCLPVPPLREHPPLQQQTPPPGGHLPPRGPLPGV